MTTDTEFERVRKVLQNAEEAFRRGDHPATRSWAQQAVTLAPNLEEPWLWLASVSNPRASIGYLKCALEINPQSPRARLEMHRAIQSLRKTNGAPRLPPVSDMTLISFSKQEDHTPEWSNNGKLDNENLPASRPFLRAARYLLVRLIAILLTIVIGVFATVVIANRGGMIDSIARVKVEREITAQRRLRMIDMSLPPLDIEAFRWEQEEINGLHLSYIPRHLLWTYNALTINWGEIWDTKSFRSFYGRSIDRTDSRLIILQRLPNTLLLIGTAYLILFCVGIPLALNLSQRRNNWLDRLIGALTPLSSVPSWVIGVLLVMIFAAELRLLPVAGMYDQIPPDTKWGYIPIVARHMVLPVLAILLSMIFHLVYTWRTFFTIFSNEDYVELGRAKGLPPRTLLNTYILRPSLPYIMTSFALTLVTFWQTITALEYFFAWPGIGQMYVKSLPNFLGETMYPGEMSLLVGIVVLFAYLLGATVFILDFVYVLVDPRLRIGNQQQTVELFAIKKRKKVSSRQEKNAWKSLPRKVLTPVEIPVRTPDRSRPVLSRFVEGVRTSIKQARLASGVASPAVIIGPLLVLLLVGGSIATVLIFPYDQVGSSWYTGNIGKKPLVPKLALPSWVNWFRAVDLPSTIILDTRDGTAGKQVQPSANGMTNVTLTYTIDFPYQGFPKDIAIYFEPDYIEKLPFASFTWITPDGREFNLKNATVNKDFAYNFSENVPFTRLVSQNKHWQKWFVSGTDYPTPSFYTLFAPQDAEEAVALPGQYTLRIDGILFEDGADLDAQLVVFGQVHGWAGTDYMRRDLLVPLLWGMPFALVIGLLGTIVTTLASLTLAAAGVWIGGWLDALIQRIIEANLILPTLAVGVLFYAFYGINLWAILIFIVLLNTFGSPTKSFRAALLQVKESPYVEAAKAYGASSWRIITRYLIPRILPVMVPQVVALIPGFVFLEATLAIFGVFDPKYPTWGRVLYSAIENGATYGSRFWVLEPIAFLLFTGLAFVLLGFSLEQILNPRLKTK